MIQSQQVEELITLVSSLDKPALLRQFRDYPATFPIDFTPDFLDRQPLERLRHLFVAVIFGLLLAPRVYFFVGDYFVGTDTLLTAPLLILLAVLVVKDGFMERARRQVLPLPVTAMPLEVPQSG